MQRLLFLLLASTIPAMGQFTEDWDGEVMGSKKFQYKQIGKTKLHLFVFRPVKQKVNAPAIVFFHGGGWQNGAPTQFQQQCRYFSNRGMVAITVEYRVEDRHKTKATAAAADGKSAMRWVRSNAKKLGIDSNRIAAGGGSAGANMATWTAILKGYDEKSDNLKIDCRPNALVLYNPPLVLAHTSKRKDFINEKYRPELLIRLGVPSEKLSPWHLIRKSMPPSLVLHGAADHAVPLWTAEAFVEKAKRAGNQSELIAFKGEDHGFFNFGLGGNKMFIATVRQTDEFFVKLGWLKGKPTIDQFVASLPKSK